MKPVCLCIIIVLGFTALWLILEGSNNRPSSPEYLTNFSGATALDSTTTLAGSGVAGPLPQDASDMIYAPLNPMANARVPNGRQGEPVRAAPAQEHRRTPPVPQENFGYKYTGKFLSDIFS